MADGASSQSQRMQARLNRKMQQLQQMQESQGGSRAQEQMLARARQNQSTNATLGPLAYLPPVTDLTKTWKKDTDAAYRKAQSEFAYRLVLCPECEIDSPGYKRAEKEIIARGFEILQKHSNIFEDTLVIYKKDGDQDAKKLEQIPEVMSVARRPKPRPMLHNMPPAAELGHHRVTIEDVTDDVTDDVTAERAEAVSESESKPSKGKRGVMGQISGAQTFFPTLNAACTAAQAHEQAVRIDTIQGPNAEVTNIGAGVTIVVWDFLPYEDRLLDVPEFTQRPGGKPKVYRDPSAAIDAHGTMVASAAAGNEVGLAKGSNLVLLGLSDNLSSDLAVITAICQQTKGPVVVNMSFGMTWQRLGSDSPGTAQQIRDFDDAVISMKNQFPQLLFVAAAGNDSADTCDAVGPISIPACRECMYWPQWFFGPPYTVKDTWFINVGATKPFAQAPHRRVAMYSNYGGCVHVYAHGTDFCCWDVDNSQYTAVRGTSFASPLFASLAALAFSASNNTMTADQVTDMLIAAADPDAVEHNSVTAQTSNKRFAILPKSIMKAAAKGDGGQGLPGDEVVNAGNLDKPEGESGATGADKIVPYVLLGAGVILLLLVMLFMMRTKASAEPKFLTVKEYRQMNKTGGN